MFASIGWIRIFNILNIKSPILRSLFLILLLIFSVAHGQNTYADTLKQKIAVAKEDSNKVNLLAELSFYYTWSFADTSIFFARQALELAEKMNYEFGAAWASGNICRSLVVLGDFHQALYFGFKALSIYEKLKQPLNIAFTYSDIALCYRDQGDFASAVTYGRKALQIVEENRFPIGELTVFRGVLGSIYQKSNQLDSAIKYCEIAYKYDKRWSGLLYTLGNAYAKKGSHAKAMEYFKKAIPMAEEQHSQIDLLDIYNGIAAMYKREGKNDSAIYYAMNAVQQEWARGYPLGVLEASSLLAGLYESVGSKDSALKYYKHTNLLKDSLFSLEKVRAMHNLAFSEQRKQQELAAAEKQYKNRIRINAMAGGLCTLLILALVLYKSNRHKQKANRTINKAYTDLKTTQVQLVQREKMASLGELTAGIAHEIQNPLNFVNNFSEVNTELIEAMKNELNGGNINEAIFIANDVEANELKINHHGKRADAIVKNMLQHSRSSTGAKQPTDINTLAEEYLRLSYHGLRAKDKSFNVCIKTDFDSGIGEINIIPQDIGRVLLNLFTNAFYAVTEKKKLQPDSYEPTVTVSTKRLSSPLGNDGKVEIRVKDNGPGIPEKNLSKVFQPFFTTRPTGEGTGLGLSLSYDIITKGHGGELKAETKEGEGAEFIIELPVV